MHLKVNEREGFFAVWTEVLIKLVPSNSLGIDSDGLARMTSPDMLVPLLLGWKDQLAMSTR
jgi:hypothetical protein